MQQLPASDVRIKRSWVNLGDYLNKRILINSGLALELV